MYTQFSTLYQLAQEREQEIRAAVNQPRRAPQPQSQNWLSSLVDTLTGRVPAATYSPDCV